MRSIISYYLVLTTIVFKPKPSTDFNHYILEICNLPIYELDKDDYSTTLYVNDILDNLNVKKYVWNIFNMIEMILNGRNDKFGNCYLWHGRKFRTDHYKKR